ncbi:hypothetical protein AAIR98_000216 [Elusimicrobium simillimum]|uniref:hypothetical protein n=1 Tax=Elusimicrobium simillimum TaxID=3143438 RepID=UPI003C704C9F
MTIYNILIKKVVTVAVLLAVLGNTCVYAQNGDAVLLKKIPHKGKQQAGPQTLAEYIERGKKDNIVLQEEDIEDTIYKVSLVAMGSYYLARGLWGRHSKKQAAKMLENLSYNKEFIKDAIDYCTHTKDIKMRNTLLELAKAKDASYMKTFLALEEAELDYNIRIIENFQKYIDGLPATKFAKAKTLSLARLRAIRYAIKQGNFTHNIFLEKENLYKLIEKHELPQNMSLLRVRADIYAHAKPKLAVNTSAYLNKDFMSFEIKFIKKGAPRVALYKWLNRFLLAGLFVAVVTSANAETEKKVERVQNNFSLLFKADAQTVQAIEANPELCGLVKAILNERHNLAVSSAEEQEEYKREMELKKKQIDFSTRNNKFSSLGVKTKR